MRQDSFCETLGDARAEAERLALAEQNHDVLIATDKTSAESKGLKNTHPWFAPMTSRIMQIHIPEAMAALQSIQPSQLVQVGRSLSWCRSPRRSPSNSPAV
jgi:hypothetical protein